ESCAPELSWELLRALSGQPAPTVMIQAAQQQLDHFIGILQAAGVIVRRPDPLPQTSSYSTPDWSSQAGYNIANPRDGLLVLGDEILETPMAWRSRYFEVHAYRSLLHEYFRRGARWTAAPKPRLGDSFYVEDYTVPAKGQPLRYVISEEEPTFDAADFTRCGRDLFATRSNVTNEFGLAWLRRHLGDRYTIHLIPTRSRQPVHIDTTFVPLAPGKALINPEYVDKSQLPPILSSWDVREAPPPVSSRRSLFDLSSAWLSMNVLMLDPQRVIVEAAQEPLIGMLEKWGFETIPVPFEDHFLFGGAFHCATLDIRRRGALQSYF
nr:amidinotransferase [Planctomycetales bacterium]NIM10040.1 amidinotransferase [Planctomycetales bacterium]NIN09481.1 amidinotransferase [Planctomycetales bacterium]NIN78589.1 amidinotransferase [Planctomycetales bacterium]NIO35783.1 amidinotransferase [Planctomycetales bacterium]